MSFRFRYRCLRAQFRDQGAEIRFLVENISPGDTAVDCGANKGSYLMALSRAAGALGRVIAFEPQPELASLLINETRQCRLTNITVEQKALSSTIGNSVLFVPGGGVSPGASLESIVARRGKHESYEVQLTTLDSYCAHLKSRISAIKIDVEGHELEVLRGAERVLRAMAPALVIECEQRHLRNSTVQEILDWVLHLGYSGWFVNRRKPVPIGDFDPKIHQAEKSGDYWNDKGYCNNFLFRKE